MPKDYDFAGYVTKENVTCQDGLVIKHGAFQKQDGTEVPLVWQHQHNSPDNVLGRVLLKTVDNGVYGYGKFNDTESAKTAQELIQHGDVNAMSIYANHVKHNGPDVIHGSIIEVSLVLRGANPGATIDEVVEHSAGDDASVIIYPDQLIHLADDVPDEVLQHDGGTKAMQDDPQATEEITKKPTPKADASSDQTIGEVLDTLTPVQMQAVQALVGSILEDKNGRAPDDPEDSEDGPASSDVATQSDSDEDAIQHNDKGGKTMKTNVFEQGKDGKDSIISHSDLNMILDDAKKLGTLKDSYIEHGITNIETLFPEAHNINTPPLVLDDQNTASQAIVDAAAKSPFSRVKATYADLTVETARARGYIKGNQKLDQVYGVLTRETTPQTVYARQTLDRDDIIDITDFDIVPWAQANMKAKLIQELARAVFVGDGRQVTDKDKISPDHIRPIVTDNDLYTIKATAATPADLVETIIKSRIDYQGTGNPTLYINPAALAEVLLLKDNEGRYLFGDIPSVDAMAARFRVSAIVETTILPAQTALIVNMADYVLGSSKGGEITNFDDFDIDFNQYKYLIETRLSGALKNPKSAIAITITSLTPTVPNP
jgi:HK97 family phage prohead protease